MYANRIDWAGYDRVTGKKTSNVRAESASEKALKPVGENLQFEITRSKLTAQQVFDIICETVKTLEYTEIKPPLRKTFDRWLAGENVPTPAFRDILSKIFKYADPKSILESDHIARRKREAVPVAPESRPGGDFGQFMSFMGTSMAKTDQEVIALLERLLKNPEKAAYARLALDWLSR